MNLGTPPPGGGVTERPLEVTDPADLTHRVGIRLGISEDVIEASIRDSQRRLKKIIITIWLGSSFIWFAMAYWLACEHHLSHLLAWAGWRPRSARASSAAGWNGSPTTRSATWSRSSTICRSGWPSSTRPRRTSSPRSRTSSAPRWAPSRASSRCSLSKDAKHPECLEHREYLARIQTNVVRLSNFVNDLLDVAKIEKGKLECVLKPVQIQETVSEVCRFFEPKAAAQGVSLANRVDHPPRSWPTRAASGRCSSTWSPTRSSSRPQGGPIEIATEQYREAGQRWLEVPVRDTGRGMDEHDRSRLFQAFSQGRNTADGVFGGGKGTGLGLYICKSIIDQHGGRIEVQSAAGPGNAHRFLPEGRAAEVHVG